MFDAESLLDKATARSIASFVGKGGGLLDLSVNESDGPSFGRKFGDNESVCRSRSVPSLVCVRAEGGRVSSVCRRTVASPDQSPDTGRELENSGDADKGVRAPAVC
jgi:hypothetical protein